MWAGDSIMPSSEEEDISDSVVVVTGANSGIGKSCTLEFAKRNAIVVMGCRDLKRSAAALDEIKLKCPTSKLVLMELDLEDLSSVRNFAEEVKRKFAKIKILVLNAGIHKTNGELEITNYGYERHMGVNHLGHFLLTNLLLDNLKASSQSRIIFVSSSVYKVAKINIEDLMLQKSKNYGSLNLLPYANSKFANMLICRELSNRVGKESNVKVYAICPGLVRTNLSRHESFSKKLMIKTLYLFGRAFTPKEGSQTLLFCALSKSLSEESGNMYRFNKKWNAACSTLDKNNELSKQLWEISEQLVEEIN